jgi:hypothetical protein
MDYNRFHNHRRFNWRPEHFAGCAVLIGLVIAAAFVAVIANGCNRQSQADRQAEDALAQEAAASIKKDVPHLDELPHKDEVPVPEPDQPIVGPCAKDGCYESSCHCGVGCPCHVTGKCCEDCPCAPTKPVWHHGRWWYKHRDGHWSMWDGKAWQRYEPPKSGSAPESSRPAGGTKRSGWPFFHTRPSRQSRGKS